jgi:hypothetical protein
MVPYKQHSKGATRNSASLGFRKNRNGPEFNVKFKLINGRIRRKITNKNSIGQKRTNIKFFNITNNGMKNLGMNIKNANWTNLNISRFNRN